MSYCRITIYELLQKHGNNPYNDVFFVEADPLFHNNGHFDYNLKSNYSVISKFKLKCPMGREREIPIENYTLHRCLQIHQRRQRGRAENL